MIYTDEEVPLLYLLPILQRIVRLTDAHKEYGLTRSQVIVLVALCTRESVTMSEVAQYMSSSKEQATRAIAPLCDQGLVERFEIPENRTLVCIRFSEKGKNFMKMFEARLRTEITAKLHASLSDAEINALRTSICTAVELLSKVK